MTNTNEKTTIELTQDEIRAIRLLLLKRQEEQIMNEGVRLHEPTIEMDLYQLFTRNLNH